MLVSLITLYLCNIRTYSCAEYNQFKDGLTGFGIVYLLTKKSKNKKKKKIIKILMACFNQELFKEENKNVGSYTKARKIAVMAYLQGFYIYIYIWHEHPESGKAQDVF